MCSPLQSSIAILWFYWTMVTIVTSMVPSPSQLTGISQLCWHTCWSFFAEERGKWKTSWHLNFSMGDLGTLSVVSQVSRQILNVKNSPFRLPGRLPRVEDLDPTRYLTHWYINTSVIEKGGPGHVDSQINPLVDLWGLVKDTWEAWSTYMCTGKRGAHNVLPTTPTSKPAASCAAAAMGGKA